MHPCRFTISPGTYRLNDQITIEGTTNFTLEASGVELIVENMTLHFGLFHNENLALEGPVTLDADPVGFTQVSSLSCEQSKIHKLQFQSPKAIAICAPCRERLSTPTTQPMSRFASWTITKLRKRARGSYFLTNMAPCSLSTRCSQLQAPTFNSIVRPLGVLRDPYCTGYKHR